MSHIDANGDGYAETIVDDVDGDGLAEVVYVDTDADGWVDTVAPGDDDTYALDDYGPTDEAWIDGRPEADPPQLDDNAYVEDWWNTTDIDPSEDPILYADGDWTDGTP